MGAVYPSGITQATGYCHGVIRSFETNMRQPRTGDKCDRDDCPYDTEASSLRGCEEVGGEDTDHAAARVQIGWLAAKAALSLRTAPIHAVHAARIFIAFVRARRRLVKSLKRRSSSVSSQITALEPSLSVHLAVSELNMLAKAAKRESDQTLLKTLDRIDPGRQRIPGPVRARWLRMKEMGEAAEGVFAPIPEKGSIATYGGRVLFALHSGAPLVNNGYSVRSTNMATACRGAGRDPTAIFRLGYPQELIRFRDTKSSDALMGDGTPLRYLPDPKLGLVGRGLNDYVSAYGEMLAEQADLQNAGVIHAASNYLNGLAAVRAARATGRASVYEVRGLWHVTKADPGTGLEDLMYAGADALESHAAQQADHVIAISGAVARYLTDRGVSCDRVTVIPNSVCTRTFAPGPVPADTKLRLGLKTDLPTIGYFGAFADYEGLSVLIEALAILRSRGVAHQAVLAGSGPERTRLEALRHRFGLETLQILDPIPHAEIPDALRIVDIAPIARLDRPVTHMVPPMKLIEVMASGCCPVISKLPVLCEIARPGREALVTEPGDSQALANVLESACRDRGRLRIIGDAARARAHAEYSLEMAATILGSVYNKIAPL